MSGQFTDQKIFITGASRGIGEAIARAFAAEGGTCLLAARSEDGLRATAEAVTERGGAAHAYPLDMGDPAAIAAVAETVQKEHGAVDVLVNNAGVTRDNLLLRMRAEEWEEVLRVNLSGLYHLTRALLRPMVKARRGRIINVSSIVGLRGNAGQANYAAAKAGIIGFTKSLAVEIASRGITVNAVAPGLIETAMSAGMTESAREEMARAIPAGRMGRPEDVAAGVLFLASEGAGYITGTVLNISGGLYL